MHDLTHMVFLENGFQVVRRDGVPVWTRQNLCAGGLFDLDLRLATEQEVAAYRAELCAKPGMTSKEKQEVMAVPVSDWWWCWLRGGNKDADVKQVRTSEGMLDLMTAFLTG